MALARDISLLATSTQADTLWIKFTSFTLPDGLMVFEVIPFLSVPLFCLLLLVATEIFSLT
jgi:hypothetical protein